MGKKKIENASATIYELQADICAALANPVRLQILELLSDSERTSSDILEIIEVPKANLSQHLAVLKEAGIIATRKEGLFQYHSLAIPHIKEACAMVRTILLERIAAQDKKNNEWLKELKIKR